MSKPLIGVILGAVLGAIDGLTAWFTPAVRDQLFGIVNCWPILILSGSFSLSRFA